MPLLPHNCLKMQESGGSIQALTRRADLIRHSPKPLAAFSLTPSSPRPQAQADAYGTAVQAAAVFTPRMLHTVNCASSDAPYQLLPLPRCGSAFVCVCFDLRHVW